MSDIETLADMIINLYNNYKLKTGNTYNGMTVYKAHYPNSLDKDMLLTQLREIDSLNKLDSINIKNLNIACFINFYYDNFYDILEYLYIPDFLIEDDRLKYYTIKYQLFGVVEKDFYRDEAKKKNLDFNYYFYDLLYMKDYLEKFEDNIPMNLKGRYGMEVANMTKLLIIIYYTNYGNDLNKLDNILLDFLNVYMDEMDINGINSWYSGKDRDKYILFLEHYLNNSLNNKKMIK